ncbi:MAG TPA: chemotaxis protein CheA [Alphaproteobacteria bacterium]|nr:chemotaxis protein CheA [Alphaproteobacteria bacterium]
MDELERFKQTFFEECAELMAVAEAGLLRLAPGEAEAGELDAIFRAVHSIKGGGGAFGFAELVAFAHEFEAVLDRLRSGRLPPSRALADALLHALDILARLLAAAQHGGAGPPEAAIVAADLRTLLEGAAATAPASAPAAAPVAPAAATPAAQAAEGPGTYRIVFQPHIELLQRGNEPLYMLRALKTLGFAHVTCHADALPPLPELEAEHLHLAWTVELTTAAGLDEIRDIFEFVVDDCRLEIVRLDAPDAGSEFAETEFAETAFAEPPAAPPAVAAKPQPPARPAPAAEDGARASAGAAAGGQTIRVDLDRIDRLVNLVGEMVITQAMVAEQGAALPPDAAPQLRAGLEELARHTRALQESVMAIRAQAVRSVFSRMPRLVREVAAETGKEVQLVMSGESTEVDKTVVETLVDPLTHMIRNSIDHGLEPPDEREALGKPRVGTVHLSAQHRSGRILIELADDGRGIDRPRVLRKARERGLVPEGAALSDEEVDNLIFLPGFSTADTVSAISGRGVGMDVVRRNVQGLGGRIVVASTPGEGTRFVLSLPLTLAVMDGMVVRVGDQRFVLPITHVVESLRPRPGDLRGLVNQCDMVMARGEYVRLVYLDQLLGVRDAAGDPGRGLVVLVETDEGDRLALAVDEVLGQSQVVIKSLEANFRRIDGVSAATILGDGRVALILDIAGIHEMGRGGARGTGRRPAGAAEARP